MKKFIMFAEIENLHGKTKIVVVCKKAPGAEHLGVIKWHTGWRQYVFEPDFGTFWSTGCLWDVNEKIVKLNFEHQEQLEKAKQCQ